MIAPPSRPAKTWAMVLVLFVGSSGALGCSGSQVNANAAGNTDPRTIAGRAQEPRNGDPTAAAPATGLGDPNAANTKSVNLSGATSTATATSGSSASLGSSEPAAPTSGSPGMGLDGNGMSNASPSPDDPKRISARHVLIQWMGSDRAGKSVLRTREQALVLAQEVLKRAQGGEDLGRLANEYSDEPNAGSRGGSLGRFTRGQMVAQFDAVAFKLRVGQISGIVETPFGFHIIQRTE